jgi:hypothetical protein
MLESIQAGFLLSGAVDEDHDQLKLLRDEVSRLIVQLDYLRNQVTDDIQRQTNYLTTERSNLQALAFAITRGELLGNSLANRPVIVNPAPVMMLPQLAVRLPQASGNQAALRRRRMRLRQRPSRPARSAPLRCRRVSTCKSRGYKYIASTNAVWRRSRGALDGAPFGFNTLQSTAGSVRTTAAAAVSAAMQRKPELQFAVVAVTPASGDPAELATMQEAAGRHAEDVKRSLIQLGTAPSRVAMSRTQTQDAKTPEVHVYVR